MISITGDHLRRHVFGDYIQVKGTLNIFGTDFNLAYGVYTDSDLPDDVILTGTLADGTAFNNEIEMRGGTFTLAVEMADGSTT